ncbi:hypothetical protein D0Z00_003262 [Geotrichum galactomycetum]|uniref:Uncharacterized protein n=1 Tax=Geotrichum galactomycetum TaxID=27317 RepID=A0ACB6V1R7_9ASCO|nr:hypothetical protein D0Z00_003262 [Geotrichum candidum]
MVWKKLNAIFLQDAPPSNALPELEYSWDIRKSISRVKAYRWSLADLPYLVMAISFTFCFFVIQNPPFLVRLAIALLLLLGCLIPITSQFFFNALPIFCWLVLFYTCQFIPHTWRPRIYVRVLPALETILYGGNLSEILSSKTNAVLDLLAWFPYGLAHFGAPFVVAAILFVFAPPKTLPVYAFAFGWMNFIGVAIQLCFPTAPPWYQLIHGLEPANYTMPGSPGGLARIDQLLGLNMYTGTFTASPMVFGAFPSLHSGCATMEALFLSHLFPKYTPVFYAYVMWIWWSTMYLTHHYFVDLIGGAVLSFIVFYCVKRTTLPHIQSDKFARWSYDYIETGPPAQLLKVRKSLDFELPLYNLEDPKSSSESDPQRMLTPIDTSFNKALHHSHHKTSSYHLYDSDVYATSASSTPVNLHHPSSPLAQPPSSASSVKSISRPNSTVPDEKPKLSPVHRD